MAYTAPTVRATGDLITAAIYNTDLVNNIKEMWHEVAYVEFVAQVNATSATVTAAVTIASAGAVTFDGVTPVIIEFFAPRFQGSDNTNGGAVNLFDGTTSTHLGTIGSLANEGQLGGPVHATRRLTPTVGSHTYFVGINDAGAVTSVHAAVIADVGGSAAFSPGYIRVLQKG